MYKYKIGKFLKKHGETLIALAVGLVISICAAIFESGHYDMTAQNWMRVMSDGCFTAAVLLIGFGLLSFIAGLGGFDHIFYLCRLMLEKIIPSKTKFEGRISYLAYVDMRRKKNAQKSGGTKNILLAGFVYLVFAILFMVIFER